MGITSHGVDFHINSLVDVKIWGKVLTLPVREILWSTDVKSPNDFTVRVGGDKIKDAIALSEKNDEVTKAIAAERKQAANNISSVKQRIEIVNSTAVKAQTTADTATSLANEANNRANQAYSSSLLNTEDIARLKTIDEDIKQIANGNKSQLDSLNKSLTNAGLQGDLTTQLTNAAESGRESQDWINSNQAQWNELQNQWNNETDGWKATQTLINQQQHMINEQQNKINEQLLVSQSQQELINDLLLANDELQTERLKEAQDKIDQQYRTALGSLHYAGGTRVENDYIYYDPSENLIGVTGNWAGFFTVFARFRFSYDSGGSSKSTDIADCKVITVPSPNGETTWKVPTIFGASSSWKPSELTIIYQRDGRKTKPISYIVSSSTFPTAPLGVWDRAFTETVEETGYINLTYSIRWEAAKYSDYYGVRLTRNGEVLGQVGPKKRIGTLINPKPRIQSGVLSNVYVTKGDNIDFEVYADGEDAVNRQYSVTEIYGTITY